MTKIGIYQITFDVHVGVTEEERTVPQQISVDIEITGAINTTADLIEETIDYDNICREVIRICCAAPVCLIETFAEKIAQTVLRDPRADSAWVRVKKDHPPLKEIKGGFVVEVQRGRT